MFVLLLLVKIENKILKSENFSVQSEIMLALEYKTPAQILTRQMQLDLSKQ